MAISTDDVWKKAKEIDYTIHKEAWSLYDIDQGVTLRARTILIKLIKLPGEGGAPPQFIQTNGVLVDVQAPFKRRHPPPKNPPTPEELSKAEKVEVPFSGADEPFNEYTFDDSGPLMFKTKLVVTGVHRIEGLYDNFGNPLYQVSHSTVIAPPVSRKVYSGR